MSRGRLAFILISESSWCSVPLRRQLLWPIGFLLWFCFPNWVPTQCTNNACRTSRVRFLCCEEEGERFWGSLAPLPLVAATLPSSMLYYRDTLLKKKKKKSSIILLGALRQLVRITRRGNECHWLQCCVLLPIASPIRLTISTLSPTARNSSYV